MCSNIRKKIPKPKPKYPNTKPKWENKENHKMYTKTHQTQSPNQHPAAAAAAAAQVATALVIRRLTTDLVDAQGAETAVVHEPVKVLGAFLAFFGAKYCWEGKWVSEVCFSSIMVNFYLFHYPSILLFCFVVFFGSPFSCFFFISLIVLPGAVLHVVIFVFLCWSPFWTYCHCCLSRLVGLVVANCGKPQTPKTTTNRPKLLWAPLRDHIWTTSNNIKHGKSPQKIITSSHPWRLLGVLHCLLATAAPGASLRWSVYKARLVDGFV